MSGARPVQVLAGLTVSGALSSLPSPNQATFSALHITGAASFGTSMTIGASLVVTGPITGTAFSGVGTSLTALNASNLSSGTIPMARLGVSGTPSPTTFLRGDNTWQQAVTAVTVTPQSGVSASVSNQGTTPQLAFTLGAITPTSVAATGNVSGTSLVATGTSTPIRGIYAGSDGSSLSFSTNSVERLSVTNAGQLLVKGPIVQQINVPAASVIDCSLGNYFQKTVSGALTWTFTNVPATGYYVFRLRLINGGKGTQTWPTNVKWPNTGLLGAVVLPLLQGTGNDILEFATDDGGTTWRAVQWTTTTS